MLSLSLKEDDHLINLCIYIYTLVLSNYTHTDTQDDGFAFVACRTVSSTYQLRFQYQQTGTGETTHRLFSCSCLFVVCGKSSCHVTQASLKLKILLPRPPKNWDHRCVAHNAGSQTQGHAQGRQCSHLHSQQWRGSLSKEAFTSNWTAARQTQEQPFPQVSETAGGLRTILEVCIKAQSAARRSSVTVTATWGSHLLRGLL